MMTEGLTVADAAKRLDVSQREVRRRIEDGWLRAERRDRRLVIVTPLEAVKPTRWFTVPEAAMLLEVSERTIYRHVRAGKLKARMAFGQWRIDAKALDRYMGEGH
jgi:excisionase family DNA binding protein